MFWGSGLGNTKVVVKAVEKEPEVVETTLSATQAGASKITITSNKDLSTDTISVKKGSTDVKITSKEFTTDGKSATLVLENKIVAADYTVAASNAAINANFTGEVSKLASIDFTSDYAIVDGELGTATTAYTYYVAKNQWDEDITSSTSLVANSSATSTTAAKGKITFTYGSALTAASLNDPLTVVVYDSTTAVTAQKTLKISNKALVATIEPYGTDGIYNANGKSLAVADKYTESFYYLFRAQDQYGNYLDDASKMTQANGFYKSYSAGLTNLGTGSLTTKEIDGVTYFAIPLVMSSSLQPGTATLILVAGGSGKSVNAQIKVNDGNTVNTISVTAPTTVAYGDNDVKFDYTALDADGNAVTSYAQLSKLTISPQGSPSSYGFYWSKVNGKAVLCFNTTRTSSPLNNPSTSLGEVVTATFLTTTYKSSMVTFNVKQQRYPAEIVGLADKVANAQLVGRNLELNVGDFKVVDQYGDAFDMKNKAYGITADLVLGSAFTAAGTNGTPAYYKQSSATGITDPAYTSSDLAIAQSADGKATSFNVTATSAGEATYEFKLVARGASAYTTLTNTIDATTKDITELGSKKISLTATANSKFVRYEVESPKTLYVTNDKDFDGTANDFGTPSQFEPSITVYGIDNTGAKVKLGTSDYQISGGANVNIGAASDKLTAAITTEAAYNKNFAVKDATLAGNFSVTMNDGTVEKVDITLSNTAPSVASLELIDGKTYLAPTVAIDADEILKNVKGKDNYGFDVKWDTASTKLAFYGNGSTALTAPSISPKLTVSDFVYAGSVVPSNGSANPDFTKIVAGDKFTVTVEAGSASLPIPVVPEASAYSAMANAAAKAITDAMSGQTVSLATDSVSDAASLKAALEAKHATTGYTVTVTITAEPGSYADTQTGTYTVTIVNTTNGGTSTSAALTVTLAS